jgi:hypothetical protein
VEEGYLCWKSSNLLVEEDGNLLLEYIVYLFKYSCLEDEAGGNILKLVKHCQVLEPLWLAGTSKS